MTAYTRKLLIVLGVLACVAVFALGVAYRSIWAVGLSGVFILCALCFWPVGRPTAQTPARAKAPAVPPVQDPEHLARVAASPAVQRSHARRQDRVRRQSSVVDELPAVTSFRRERGFGRTELIAALGGAVLIAIIAGLAIRVMEQRTAPAPKKIEIPIPPECDEKTKAGRQLLASRDRPRQLRCALLYARRGCAVGDQLSCAYIEEIERDLAEVEKRGTVNL